MRESNLLAHIASMSRGMSTNFPRVIVGPGDDAAVLRTPEGGSLLLTVDHVVEGRHVALLGENPSAESLDAMARKLVARNLSDIAAMGGSPYAGLATALLPPEFPQDSAAYLADRIHHWGAHWDCPIIGGDVATALPTSPTSPTPRTPSTPRAMVSLTMTALGLPHPTRGAVLRSGAREGDGVFVTGRLGGAVGSGRHAQFEPRLLEARGLADRLGPNLTAMMDISDGLGRDASHLAQASQVDIVLESALLPCHVGVADWKQAAGEGEDYELLFTVRSGANVRSTCAATGTPITQVGVCVHTVPHGGAPRGEHERPPGHRSWIKTPQGVIVDASEFGWDHGGA